MHLYERLKTETATDRDRLLAAPAIQRVLHGDVTPGLYRRFLVQAWHHVRHTVPLLLAVETRLPERHRWLKEAVLHYVDEVEPVLDLLSVGHLTLATEDKRR